MRKRLLWIAAGLAAIALVAAGVVYGLYKSGAFRSTKTERGETLSTNEANGPERPRRRPAQPAWPYFRYDDFRTGYNPDAVARPPFSVAWKRKVPRDGYLEAPAVTADGVLVYGSYGKRFGSDLFAVDARTGRTRWHKHYRHPANFAGSPGIAGGRVYITSHDGNIRVYDLRTGRIRWRKKIASSESPPIVRGKLVYFGDGPKGGNGTFRAVDIRTRRTVWRYRASGTISSGAALTRSTAYFASYGGSVYAVDRFTGRLRWRTAVNGARGNSVPFYSTPAIEGGKLVVGGNDGSVYALDARSGAQKWRYDAGGYVYSSAAIWHGRVFIGDFGGGFHALSLKSGRGLWTRHIGPILGSATVMRGIVYISSLRPPRTYAFDARTGRQVWKFNDGQFSPVIADGHSVWLVGKAHVYGLVERSAARRRAAAARRAARRRARCARAKSRATRRRCAAVARRAAKRRRAAARRRAARRRAARRRAARRRATGTRTGAALSWRWPANAGGFT